jgi:hypothetical protein
MNPADAAAEMERLSKLLDAGLAAIVTQVNTYAEKERDYRKAKAEAWVQVSGTAKEREAQVDAMSADARYMRDLADGMRQAALEAVRSRRAQLSALQSLLAGHRAEAEFVRTSGGMHP